MNLMFKLDVSGIQQMKRPIVTTQHFPVETIWVFEIAARGQVITGLHAAEPVVT